MIDKYSSIFTNRNLPEMFQKTRRIYLLTCSHNLVLKYALLYIPDQASY